MIKGTKIILRPFEEKDLEDNARWMNDINFQRMFLRPFPISAHEEKEWYKSLANDSSRIMLSIQSLESKEYLGNVGISSICYRNGTASFFIYIGSQSHRGQGLGYEAADLMLRYSFNDLNLRKIYLNVVADNSGAIDLYKKLGFETEGILKEEIFVGGEYKDLFRMSIFRKNYMK